MARLIKDALDIKLKVDDQGDLWITTFIDGNEVEQMVVDNTRGAAIGHIVEVLCDIKGGEYRATFD